ncbi:MAG: cytochrome b/b6 domain-containing protein [Rhodospirillales bacterium]|nr:cytochrome b/b6 domain-containing protein [Rhodospirillales bacterium]
MSESDGSGGAGDLDRLVRHQLADRLYHWTLATSVIVLLGTAFLPIAGFKFPWLEAHWIAGIVLTVIVLIHIVRALVWQDHMAMWVGMADLKRSVQSVNWILRRRSNAPDLPGKYPLLQKLYHHGIASVVLTLIGTGLVMMVKIDTPFWQRNPYLLSADTWGWIYVVHDLAAMAALALIIIHIYFAIRPEKLWITRSMILGWITRREFREHHDPDQWQPEP